MLDADRTDFLTRAARPAGPQCFGSDNSADEIDPVTRAALSLVIVGAKVEDEVARAERIARRPRRTGFVTTAAFGAGVEMQHVLPCKILDRGNSGLLGIFWFAWEQRQRPVIPDQK